MSLTLPFTKETAYTEVKKAQDLGNDRDPKTIAQAYAPDSIWRNRSFFLVGTAVIEDFLTKKWEKEKCYRLRKELFVFTENKIAVQFWYEYQDAHHGLKWKRCYSLEDLAFTDDGKMRKRQMSVNDIEIDGAARWFKDGVDINKVDVTEHHW